MLKYYLTNINFNLYFIYSDTKKLIQKISTGETFINTISANPDDYIETDIDIIRPDEVTYDEYL